MALELRDGEEGDPAAAASSSREEEGAASGAAAPPDAAASERSRGWSVMLDRTETEPDYNSSAVGVTASLEPARRRVSALARSIARNEQAVIELRVQLHAALEAHSQQLTEGLRRLLTEGPTPGFTARTHSAPAPPVPFCYGAARLSAPGALGGGAAEHRELSGAVATLAHRRRSELRIEREQRLKQQLRASLSAHMAQLTAGLSGLLAQQELLPAVVEQPPSPACTAAEKTTDTEAGGVGSSSADVPSSSGTEAGLEGRSQEGGQREAGSQPVDKGLEKRLQQAEEAAARQASLYAEAVARADQLAQECAALRAAAARTALVSSEDGGSGVLQTAAPLVEVKEPLQTCLIVKQQQPEEQGLGQWQLGQQQKQEPPEEGATGTCLAQVPASRAADAGQQGTHKRRTFSEPNLSLAPAGGEEAAAAAGMAPLVELDAAWRLFCDNRTLAWECFHLQALLVRERMLAKASAQAGALQLAAQCVGLQQRLREVSAELQLMQTALPAAAGRSEGVLTAVVGLGTASSTAPPGAVDEAASSAQIAVATLRQSVGAMIEDSRDETEALLTALAHCQERVAAHFDDAAWAEGVQAQLDQIRAADGPEQLKKVVAELQSNLETARVTSPGEQLAACGAVGRGRWCSSQQQQQQQQQELEGGGAITGTSGEAAAGQGAPRCFVTTPSGHITPMASRRTTLMGRQPSRASSGPCLAAVASELAARTAAGRRRTGAATAASDSGLAAIAGAPAALSEDDTTLQQPEVTVNQQPCVDERQLHAGRPSLGVRWHASTAGRPSRVTGEGLEGVQSSEDSTAASARMVAAARLVSDLQQAAVAALQRLVGDDRSKHH